MNEGMGVKNKRSGGRGSGVCVNEREELVKVSHSDECTKQA